MHLIDNGTQVTSLPSPRTAVGTPGFAFNGDPGTGTPTIADPDIFNTLLAELAGVVQGVGIALDRTNNAQLLSAITRLVGASVTAISANTTLTADQAGLVIISAASANVTVTLPANNAANGKPMSFTFVRTDATANTVTIARAGSNTLWPGTGTSRLMTPLSVLTLAGSGSGVWYEVSRPPPGMQEFTASGTFTVPAGVTEVEVEVWGGGGGSSASSGAGVFTNGAGGGGYARKRVRGLTPGGTVAVTVGVGGIASASGVAGGNGGTSSFGAYVSASGGDGATVTVGLGAAGGTGSGGDTNVGGGLGAGAIPSINAGNGGNASAGGQGGWGGQSTSNAGQVPGGGAGGAGNGCNGAGTFGTSGTSGAGAVFWRQS